MFDFIPTEYFLLAFGFILLIKGGDWFVDAACGIAGMVVYDRLVVRKKKTIYTITEFALKEQCGF